MMETILNYLNQGDVIMHDVIIVMSQWKWTWLWYYAWRHKQHNVTIKQCNEFWSLSAWSEIPRHI